jgi:hypothetical protein
MDMPDTVARSTIKTRLLTLLQTGTGSLVLATTILTAPAPAATETSSDSLLRRAERARAEILRALPAAGPAMGRPAELAWWGKRWGNGGWHPEWHNWSNGWHNWSNRPSWSNW